MRVSVLGWVAVCGLAACGHQQLVSSGQPAALVVGIEVSSIPNEDQNEPDRHLLVLTVDTEGRPRRAEPIGLYEGCEAAQLRAGELAHMVCWTSTPGTEVSVRREGNQLVARSSELEDGSQEPGAARGAQRVLAHMPVAADERLVSATGPRSAGGVIGESTPGLPVKFVGNRVLDTVTLARALAGLDAMSTSDVFHGVVAAYMNAGFIEVQVEVSAQSVAEPTMVRVHREGGRYRLGRLAVQDLQRKGEGDPLGVPDRVLAVASLSAGEWFDRGKIGRSIDAVNRSYQDAGYAFAVAFPVTAIDRDRRLIDLTFQVERGPIARVSEFQVVGSEKVTLAEIEKHLLIHVGERFHRSRLEASQRALQSAGLFKKVELKTEQVGELPEVRVLIEVSDD